MKIPLPVKQTLYMLVFLSAYTAYGQKEYNTWYFGWKAGLSFNSSTATAITGSKKNFFETATGICDSSGRILFYTDGDTIMNRNHQVMLNSRSSQSSGGRLSYIEGALAARVPGSETLYYLFYGMSSGSFYDSSMVYWVVDMDGDGGLGEVVVKDKPLLGVNGEGMGMTFHANRKDYWVAAISYPSGNFNCVRTTNGMFVTPPLVQPLKNANTAGYARLYNKKFSPDSRIFSATMSTITTGSVTQNFYTIYRFNNSTGKLSASISIPKNKDMGYICEFSPDSRFLYLVNIQFGTRVQSIEQYDLSVWDSATIVGSQTTIMMDADMNLYGLQLGPDGKIYCFQGFSDKVSAIEKPWLKGTACQFTKNIIDVSPGNIGQNCPYYPTFLYAWRHELGNDTLICQDDSLILSVSDTFYNSILWSTGDTTRHMSVREAGIYTVQLVYDHIVYRDTIRVKMGKKFKVYLGSDTAFCAQFSHLLDAGKGFKKYNWNTGDSFAQITVNKQGIYSIKVQDSNSCPGGDTIGIDAVKKPVIGFQYDSITCKYVYLSVERQPGIYYLWSTGDTGISARVDKKGLYKLTASHRFCDIKDSILINLLPAPEFDLGPDTVLCTEYLELKVNGPGNSLWNDGSVSHSMFVRQPGKYWVEQTRGKCGHTDTILIKPCQDMTWFIPNAFSPDGNVLNDVFKVYGTNITHIKLNIYNRWGELIFEGNGDDPTWDGTYKNEICQQGVYFYQVELTAVKNRTSRSVSGSFTLLK